MVTKGDIVGLTNLMMSGDISADDVKIFMEVNNLMSLRLDNGYEICRSGVCSDHYFVVVVDEDRTEIGLELFLVINRKYWEGENV